MTPAPGSVRQDVVPRLVARRAGAGYLLVPILGAAKEGVDVEDHTAVVEEPMVDQLSGGELGAITHN